MIRHTAPRRLCKPGDASIADLSEALLLSPSDVLLLPPPLPHRLHKIRVPTYLAQPGRLEVMSLLLDKRVETVLACDVSSSADPLSLPEIYLPARQLSRGQALVVRIRCRHVSKCNKGWFQDLEEE